MANHKWLDELESEIGSTTKKKTPRPVVVKRVAPPAPQQFGAPLFLLVLLLAVTLVGTYLYKQGHFTFRTDYLQKYSQSQYTYRDYQYDRDERYRRTDNGDELWRRSRWNSDVVTLMSIVNNHNLVVTQNGHPKSHYIYINEDWTIDRLPDHVYLDSQSRAFLERFVRKG